MAIETVAPYPLDITTQSDEQVTMTEFALEANAVTRLDLTIIARAQDTGLCRTWDVAGLYRRTGDGAPGQIGRLDLNSIGDSELADAGLSVGLGDFTIAILVTGVLNTPLDWSITGTTRAFKPQP